jgi:hypothetical protein
MSALTDGFEYLVLRVEIGHEFAVHLPKDVCKIIE